MDVDGSDPEDNGRASPDARIPMPLAAGLGLQVAGLVLPGAVLIPTVVFRGAGQPEEILLWALFASLVACGATTILQALRLGRIGAGYLIATGASGAAIAVSIAALEAGGVALLASLVLAMALLQFAFSIRLAPFRSVLTPTVTGTIIMLTPVTVMPVIFEQLNNVPAGTAPVGGPLSALTTLATVVGIVLAARGPLRLWAPVVGIVAGGVAAIAGTLFLQLIKPRGRTREVAFDQSSLREIREFLAAFASRSGWDEAMAARLDAVSEETLLTLLARDDGASRAGPKRLLVAARPEDGGAILEFVSARGDGNLQDRIALLGEVSAGDRIEEEVSLRLLRHLASSVRHQQYHDMDVVTVRVEPPGRMAGAGE